MTKQRMPRHRGVSPIRLLVPLVACLLAAGCLLPIDSDPSWKLTFQGQVDRAGSAAPVPGARVDIWVDPPVPMGNAPPFVTGTTNAQGAFVLSQSLRTPGLSPDVVVRITPPAESGLQAGSFSGHVSQLFTVGSADREYTYSGGDFTLQPAPGS